MHRGATVVDLVLLSVSLLFSEVAGFQTWGLLVDDNTLHCYSTGAASLTIMFQLDYLIIDRMHWFTAVDGTRLSDLDY